jgi:4-carboxymuconolactone decarboxylase
MRLLLFFLILTGLAAAYPQAPENRDPGLVGNRFAPLTYETMTPEQRAMVDGILAGPRNSLGGPFNVMLRNPAIGDLAQQLGAAVRFNVSIPPRLRELAIIMTARHWTSHFEWNAHRQAAVREGLDESIVRAIAAGRRPEGMDAAETVVYDFSDELLRTKRVTDATFQAAVEELGEAGVADIVSTLGYYGMVAMMLNVDEYPLPDGVAMELAPLTEN